MPAKFTAARRDRNRKDSFEIEWYDAANEPQIETFWCFPGRLPGGYLFDILRISEQGSTPFWRSWMTIMDPDEYERFYAFAHNPDVGVDASVLRQAMDWVIEYDTGRPTMPPSP